MTAPRPATRATRRSQDVALRREQLLEATIAVVESTGLAGTRVADVASALGVSTALVFYHFGSKDALVAAAFEHAVERDLARLDDALARGRGPLDTLRRVLRLYGPTGSAAGWRLWIDAWALAQREPVLRRVLRRLDERWTSVLLRVVTDGVTSGDLVCPDPRASVARISALLDGLSVANLVYGSVTRADLRVWVAATVAAELGVAPDALA